LITIYWRDIPAQVIGQVGRKRHKLELSRRFAVAIDRAAMRAGRGSSKAYLEDWRRERRSCEGDVQAVVNAEAARLEALFPDEVLEGFVKAGGTDPSASEKSSEDTHQNKNKQ
jgi:uncharacterized protein